MESCTVKLKSVLALSSSNLGRAPKRRFCHSGGRFQDGDLVSRCLDIGKSLSRNLVLLESFFFAPDDRGIHRSCRRGAGVCVDSELIVTSANVVGRVSTLYKPRTAENSDRFEHGSILHKSYIASTLALTADGMALKTMPLAVNFVNDISVLRLLEPEETLLRHCALAANSVLVKENILIAIAQEQSPGFVIQLGNVRALGEKTIRAKAPWPLDDDLAWIEHDWEAVGGNPPPNSVCREKVTGSITRNAGSPLFNLDGEVIGITSWEARDEAAKFSVGFAVPHLCISSMVDYAKTKRPDDPIVTDCWINAHLIPE